MDDRITATYRIKTAHLLEKAAEVLAGEQSASTFVKVPFETPDLLARHGARIERITPLDSGDSSGVIRFKTAEICLLYQHLKRRKGIINMAIKIALMGAGGKMGCRLTDNIRDDPKYQVSYVEVSPPGIENLAQRGITPTPQAEALANADVVILALPDRLIGKITHEIIPTLKPGTMVMGLDPAAAYAEVMPIRDDLTYFVTHPCHPPLFGDEVTEEARLDWFGGIKAKQHIVCALHHGPEEAYAKGEMIARDIYKPVMESYRITVEQMAILEPALVETFSATVITAIKQAYDKAVEMGVPAEAAWAFLSGHARIEFAIVFGLTGFDFSDGAKLAIAQAYDKIFKPDWLDNIMNLDALKESVAQITHKNQG